MATELETLFADAIAKATNASDIAYQWANGDETTIISTAAGDLSSLAKFMFDNVGAGSFSELEIDLSLGDVILTTTEVQDNAYFKAIGNTVPRTITLPPTVKLMYVANAGSDVLTVVLGTESLKLTPLSVVILYLDGSANGLVNITEPHIVHHEDIIDPTVNDDINDGYDYHSSWINTATNKLFICADPTATAALWVEVTNTIASQAEAEIGTENTKIMTPLRVQQKLTFEIGNTIQGYDVNTAKYDDLTANFTGDLQVSGSSVVSQSSLLTDILTVDGSGSGIDADLLDGVQGANYARKDLATLQVFNGNLKVGVTAASGNEGGQIDLAKAPSGTMTQDPYIDINGDNLRFVSFAGGTTRVLTLPPESGTVWHSGNDGTGSGLDADLLDGQQGSYYQPASTAVTKDSDTGAANLPAGTIAQRPSVPAAGMFRYNSETDQFEGHNGSTWGGVGGASGGAGNPFVYENDATVTADYTITSGKNAMSAGPITINTGVTVTVPTGSTWVIV